MTPADFYPIILYPNEIGDYMWESIKSNPVRILAIAGAALALVAFYVPSIPVPLILALVAAVFGGGAELARQSVTPNGRVALRKDEVPELSDQLDRLSPMAKAEVAETVTALPVQPTSVDVAAARANDPI